MLRELCTEGYSLLSRDETGKTALHYGARLLILKNSYLYLFHFAENIKKSYFVDFAS